MTELRGPRSNASPAARCSVVLVAEDGQAGGIGRYCIDLASSSAEWAVACLCPTACDEVGCWLREQCSTRGVPLYRVPMPVRGWRRGLTGFLRLWRHLDRPMVHVNGRRGNFVSVAARLTTPGFRFITTAHGVLALHDRRNLAYRIIDLTGTWAAAVVIAVSEDTRRRLVRAGSPRQRTIVVSNGLADGDLQALQVVGADRAELVGRTIRIGFLGRLSPEKGTRALLQLVRGVADSGADASVVVAGDGPDRAWLDAHSRSLQASGVVSFLGSVRDVRQFLAMVDILVMPSQSEGLPFALLEGMAAGCAVVAFEVGGIPEVLTKPELGVLVAAGDTDAFVRAVIDLAADLPRLRAIGATGSAHVPNAFALRDRIPLLASAYRLELRASSRQPPVGLA